MTRSEFAALFRHDKPLIGMLHVPALPGSPANSLTLPAILSWVLRDAETLTSAGMHGLLLENFGDAPFYRNRVPPHTIAFLTALAQEVSARFPVPLGINVLRNDARAALAAAAASGAAFIRVNVYTGARLTDQGIIQGEAHRVQRYRAALGCSVRVFADVAVKHSAALAPRPLAEEVEDTVVRGRADAIIVTGAATGHAAPWEDLRTARAAAADTPCLAGSGAVPERLTEILSVADGVIAGTALKRDGVVSNPADPARVQEFVSAARLSRA